MKSDKNHQIYSLNIKSEDRDRNMQASQSETTTNYTDLKSSPNSSITKKENNRNTVESAKETSGNKTKTRHSLRNVDGSKKTNKELWREQQAKFSKLIEFSIGQFSDH